MRRRKVLQLGAAVTAVAVAAPAIKLMDKSLAPQVAADEPSWIEEAIDMSGLPTWGGSPDILDREPRPVHLVWSPVIPGTLTITDEDGGQILVDDGMGNLIGDGSGKINYYTGALDKVEFKDMEAVRRISFAGCSPVSAKYCYDSERGYLGKTLL